MSPEHVDQALNEVSAILIINHTCIMSQISVTDFFSYICLCEC